MKQFISLLAIFGFGFSYGQTIDTIVTIDTTTTIDTVTTVDTILIRHFDDGTSDSMVTHKIDSMTFDDDTITNYNYSYTFDTTVTYDTSFVGCNGLTSLTYNGYTYDLVEIGDQCWFKKNLQTTTYRDLTPIGYPGTNNTAWINDTTGAYAWYNNDSSTYAPIYGALYNWHAVNNSAGLCPSGWHVPTISEWNQLTIYLDSLADTTCNSCNQSSIAGGAMKSIGTQNWTSPNTGATNSSGFSGLPGGLRRKSNGNYDALGTHGHWWGSSEYLNYSAWARYLYYDYSIFSGIINDKTGGFSIRCIKE